MNTLVKVENFELYRLDRRTHLAPQMQHFLSDFVLKHRTKPAKILWNPGTYRMADDDTAPEVDADVPKGFVKMVVR